MTKAELMVKRDRAVLELLYASGLRVSELTGLNLGDVDRKELMLRVRGKGNKERIVPYGGKAEQALEAYEPLRQEMLRKAGGRGDRQAVFINHLGTRLTQRSVGRIVKKYARMANANWDLHPHSLRHAFATHLLADGARIFARFRNYWATRRCPPRRGIRTPRFASFSKCLTRRTRALEFSRRT